MHTRSLRDWQHDHTFGQDVRREGERRTIIVIAVTAIMMVAEIVSGVVFGSMALLADGLHMASHAAALTVTAVAYVVARRRAGDPRYSFGTGKVNALGGFTSAVLLAVFALIMVVESAERMLHPVAIRFDQAVLVAVLGLVVNGASALILAGGHGHDHGHGHGHGHDLHHDQDPGHDHDHDHGHDHDRGHGHAHAHAPSRRHADHNLRAAYLHVLADALTSVLAIAALLAGKYFGAAWLDPAMGFVGAFLVARWSRGLLRDTSRVLLDEQTPAPVLQRIRESIERGTDDRVADLHVWSVGPGLFAATISVVAGHPQPPDDYKRRLPEDLGLVHTIVETHRCPDGAAGSAVAERAASGRR